MTIIGPLPFTLENGTTADATEVMANLNQIRNDVNANAGGGGGSGNVVGPNGAVDGHIAVFDGVTGKILKDGGLVVGYRGAYVPLDGDQHVNAASTIVLQFDSAVIDTSSIFSLFNPTKLYVPAGASIVRLYGQGYAGGAEPGSAQTLYARKNGSEVTSVYGAGESTNANPDGGVPTIKFTSFPLVVTPGDYFEMLWGNSGNTGFDIDSVYTFFELQVLT